MLKTRFAGAIASLFPGVQGQLPVIADNGAMPDQISLINAILSQNPWQAAIFNNATNTSSFTATQSQVMGAEQTYLSLTGAAGAGVALTLPTAATLQATLTAQQNAIGSTVVLRILNTTSQVVTVTTNTGWTLTGTMTIATATWRDFIVNIVATATPTMTLQSVGTGTQS